MCSFRFGMFFSVKVFDMPLLSSAQHRIMKYVVLMAKGAMLHIFAIASYISFKSLALSRT